MAKTENLGLELTTQDTTTFKAWRESINGQGDGITQDKSNMQLIDEAIGDIDTALSNILGV